MEVRLTIVGGTAATRLIRLKLPAVIGRSRDADLTIAHPMVSRQHCELFEAQGLMRIRDLGSLNGTLVGDKQVTEASLRPKDEFTIGPLTFRVDYDYAGDSTAVTPTVPDGPVESADMETADMPPPPRAAAASAPQVPPGIAPPAPFFGELASPSEPEAGEAQPSDEPYVDFTAWEQPAEAEREEPAAPAAPQELAEEEEPEPTPPPAPRVRQGRGLPPKAEPVEDASTGAIAPAPAGFFAEEPAPADEREIAAEGRPVESEAEPAEPAAEGETLDFVAAETSAGAPAAEEPPIEEAPPAAQGAETPQQPAAAKKKRRWWPFGGEKGKATERGAPQPSPAASAARSNGEVPNSPAQEPAPQPIATQVPAPSEAPSEAQADEPQYAPPVQPASSGEDGLDPELDAFLRGFE